MRAALVITRHIGSLETPAGKALNVHIGIATGRVIIGDLFAGGEDRHSIIGSTPNLAASLQGFAPPGGIAIADETYARVAALFVCEDLGEPPNARLRAGPPCLARDRRGGGPRANLQLRSPAHALPRPDRGTRVLTQHWRRACDGHGNTVVVTGEAGIGKSRLVEHFSPRCRRRTRRADLRRPPSTRTARCDRRSPTCATWRGSRPTRRPIQSRPARGGAGRRCPAEAQRACRCWANWWASPPTIRPSARSRRRCCANGCWRRWSNR